VDPECVKQHESEHHVAVSSRSLEVEGRLRHFRLDKLHAHDDAATARLSLLRALISNQCSNSEACAALITRQERMRSQISRAERMIELADSSSRQLRDEMIPVLNQLKDRALNRHADDDSSSSSSAAGSAASRSQSQSQSQSRSLAPSLNHTGRGSSEHCASPAAKASPPVKPARRPRGKRDRTYDQVEPAPKSRSSKPTKKSATANAGNESKTGLTADLDLADLV